MTVIDKTETLKEESCQEEILESSIINYKTYKTIDEQIEYLKEKKNILVSDKYKEFLRERNYVSVINPYKEFFTVGKDKYYNHVYKDTTDFINIMKLIKVDDDFSSLLYSYISLFERKFKNILITEMCNKYMANPNDLECISYINEINIFLKSNDDETKVPRFCPNLPFQLSKKGIVSKDSFGLTSKKELLLHIMKIGCIEYSDDDYSKKSNKLIKHYLKKQKIAPLWAIPNALTLGELKILFSMLDVNAQKRITALFLEEKKWEKLNSKDILSFSGVLEVTRNIRNVINHYEPLFPYLQEQLKSYKKMENSRLFKVLHILENNYNNSLLNDIDYIDVNELKSNPSTKRNIDILKLMKEYIK